MANSGFKLRDIDCVSDESREFKEAVSRLFPEMLDLSLGFEFRTRMNELTGMEVENGPVMECVEQWLPRLRQRMKGSPASMPKFKPATTCSR